DGSDTGTTVGYSTVGDALDNLDQRVVENTAAIADLSDATDSGLVQQATPDAAITVGAGTGGDEVDFSNQDGDGRRLSGIAEGVDDDDALTVGQLRDSGVIDGSGEVLAVAYDDASRAAITLAGTDGTVIDNLAPGAVDATSMQAINGAQLFSFG